MAQSPKSITTEIERDYPGRFLVEAVELERLIADIMRLLRPEKPRQTLKIAFWVRLENGVLYETDKLDVVLKEENSRRQRIRLLIIFAELQENDDKPLRRIVVQISRGKAWQRPSMLENIGGEVFNLAYHGLNYRVRDRNRESALEAIATLEERLAKFRRWYSNVPQIQLPVRSIGPIGIINVLWIFLSMMLYALAGLAPTMFGSYYWYDFPRYTTDFLRASALGSTILVLSMFLGVALTGLFYWLLPPTVIAIGDEIMSSKKNQRIRELVFSGVVLAGMVGIVVNLITDSFSSR